MAWLWRKKNKTPQATDMTTVTSASTSTSTFPDVVATEQHTTEQDWQVLETQHRKEQKRRKKDIEREAKRAMKEMKKQVKMARRERAKTEKLAKKHARVVLKIQKKEQKTNRKRAKTMMKATRTEEKRRKRLIRKRKREEKRRRKQAQQQDKLHRQRVQAEVETEEMRAQSEANAALAATMTAAATSASNDGGAVSAATQEPPKFKEGACCKACAVQFQRLPTRRRHHCRNCGESFCSKCLSKAKRPIPWFKLDKPQKVCFSCDIQVFNGIGSNSAPPLTEAVRIPAAASSPAQVRDPQPEIENSRLCLQRSASFQSESPENDSPASSPSSRGLSFRLRPRSRRDTNSPKNKKRSKLWSLPLRPLLKRKQSADQLRNRSWDLDLRLEKEEMLARQRKSQMIVVP